MRATGDDTLVFLLKHLLAPLLTFLGLILVAFQFRKGVRSQSRAFEVEQRSKVLDLLLDLNKRHHQEPDKYQEFLAPREHSGTVPRMSSLMRAEAYYHINMFDRAYLYREERLRRQSAPTWFSHTLDWVERMLDGAPKGEDDTFGPYWDNYVGQVMSENPEFLRLACDDTRQNGLYSQDFYEYLVDCRDGFKRRCGRGGPGGPWHVMTTAPRAKKGSVQLIESRTIEDYAPVLRGLDFEDSFPATMLRWCRLLPRNPETNCWFVRLVQLRGQVVGVCGLYTRFDCPSDRAWLGWFGLLPEYRRSGIGSAVLERLEREARAWGCTSLWVFTGQENSAGQSFYRRAGFEVPLEPVSPEEHRRWTFDETDVILSKSLATSRSPSP